MGRGGGRRTWRNGREERRLTVRSLGRGDPGGRKKGSRVERKVRRGSRPGKCYLPKRTAAASAFSVVNEEEEEEEEDKDVEK